ncbi:TonB-dependent receptor [Tahibacter amnicola]|uniref:TonB-dependent receptor n=1 Tax=Tahibacter amnicola TaxID=2976241 RepID=A0ABY6BG26_9GAMM|nr:TonB-dependent receptor [Tahibacter amnicola]UXI68978.1 TonB-dependent receptor [Tahibacter amnicola]
MIHRRNLLAASIVAALGLYGIAHAETNVLAESAVETAADEKTTQELEEVVVKGIRQSLKASLDAKREADAVVESITAEDIGKFPNTNVAEAIAQVPGVTIDRRFGQGERVSIDGTDPSLNLSFLDGHPVAQSVWLYGEQPNRGFDYTQIASEILGRLEIYKSPEARLPEGSIGGTVLMHTRKPLDLESGTMSGSVGYSYSEQGSEGKPNGSFLFSSKNADETFGIAVAAQHYEEQVDRQGIEIFGYAPASRFTNATGVPGNAQVPNSINAAWFQQTRKRNSAVVNLQFKPTDRFEAELSGLYIRENYDNYNQSMYSFITWTPATVGAVDQLGNVRGGVVTSGHSSADGGAVIYDNQARESEVTTKGVDLSLAYHGETWDVSGQLGHSDSENPNVSQWFIEPVYQGGFSWDINRGITFDNEAAARDPANWKDTGWLGNRGVFSSAADDTYAQIDFSRSFNSVFNQLLFGYRHHKHDESYALHVYGGVRLGSLANVGTIGYVDTMGAFNGFSYGHGHHLYVGRDNVINWVRNSPIDYAHPDAGSTINNTWALTQETDAVYGQLNFATDGKLHGNFGVRFVNVDTDASGYNPGGAAPVLPAPAGWWQTRSSSYNKPLPSFNLIYDATDDVVLRFTGAKVIAWAPYNQMVNNTFLNDATLTGAGGNANLGPYESNNFNVSAEWYFADQSVLAASVFYKRVSNYIDRIARTERQYNSIRDNNPTQWATMVGFNGCTADGFCDYSVSRPYNAGSARIKGFTLSYQQPFGETGFGVSTNYTFADGETNDGNDMPYQSRHSAAISPYYEQGPFSARLTYNYRSHYLAGGYVAGAAPASVDDYAEVGASIGWNFTENLGLSFDAMNLTDEKYFQYLGTKEFVAGKYSTGRRYMLTLRASF